MRLDYHRYRQKVTCAHKNILSAGRVQSLVDGGAGGVRHSSSVAFQVDDHFRGYV